MGNAPPSLDPVLLGRSPGLGLRSIRRSFSLQRATPLAPVPPRLVLSRRFAGALVRALALSLARWVASSSAGDGVAAELGERNVSVAGGCAEAEYGPSDWRPLPGGRAGDGGDLKENELSLASICASIDSVDRVG